MTKVSKSPQRHSFQKDCYIKQREELNEPVSNDMLDMFDKILEEDSRKFDTLESRKNNMEYDLLTTDWILEKTRTSNSYAQNLYAAICNNDFQKRDVWPILKDEVWGCSWRYAGGIIADMQQAGDYIDWYCSGISGGDDPDTYALGADLKRKQYVPEGTITDEIREDLFKLGWLVK